MKFCDRNDFGFALAIDRLHIGVKRPHGYRHIRRMRRDTVIAGTQDGVNAVKTGNRGAAGAGISLIAGFCDVIEIVTAGSLQQIAAGGGLVAQLGAGAGQQCAAQHAITLPHARVGGEITVSNQCADTQAPSAVSSILSSGNRLMSTRLEGVSTCSFMRSSRLVPPAMILTRLDGSGGGLRGGAGALIGEAFMSAFRCLFYRSHDVRVGGAAADVAAHPLANFRIGEFGARVCEVLRHIARHALPVFGQHSGG